MNQRQQESQTKPDAPTSVNNHPHAETAKTIACLSDNDQRLITALSAKSPPVIQTSYVIELYHTERIHCRYRLISEVKL